MDKRVGKQSSGSSSLDVFYEVEDILDRRFRNGRFEFLLKWKGYPNSQNSWEPEENMQSRAMIQEFENERAIKRKSKSTPHTENTSMASDKSSYAGRKIETINVVRLNDTEIAFSVKYHGVDCEQLVPRAIAYQEFPQLIIQCFEKLVVFTN